MKALRSHAIGGPESLTLDELESPVPGPGQVRIKVKACSINYPDVLIIKDMYQFKPARPLPRAASWPAWSTRLVRA